MGARGKMHLDFGFASGLAAPGALPSYNKRVGQHTEFDRSASAEKLSETQEKTVALQTARIAEPRSKKEPPPAP